MTGPDFDAMVAASPKTAPSPAWRKPTRFDAWWGSSPHTVLRWLGPIGVLVTAVVSRTIGLSDPHQLLFDETYYVKDAWSTWNLGYESTWQGDPAGEDDGWTNKQFAAGNADVYTGEGSFAVHPPLGKWLIGLGIATVGQADPASWRIASAVAGILLVGLIMLVAHRLTRSLLTATIAGGLLAIDGNGIVMSRLGLLDGFLGLFALLAFYFVLLDRDRTARTGAVWWRPWLFAAGIALGAACSIKWSGVWFVVFFGMWTVIADLLHPRSAHDWWRRPIANFLMIVPIALATYLVTWAGWFASDPASDQHAWGRDWADIQSADGSYPNAWTGFWSWVPHSVQSFLHQQAEVLGFHNNLRADHPYKSPAWQWLLLFRPTAVYYYQVPDCPPGTDCAGLITDLPNPLIWYASVAALVWLIVFAIWKRSPAAWAVLVGFGAGYLPWLMFPERPTYFFYSIAYQPFLILALAMALQALLGRPSDERSRRLTGQIVVSVFLVLCAGLSLFFWPVWTGQLVPIEYLRLHYWFPGWI